MGRDVAVLAVLAVLGLLACGALAGCTSLPACKYRMPEQSPEAGIIGKIGDESQMPMLPHNPYWISTEPSLPVAGSPGDPCAGEPYHPGRLPP